MIELTRIEGEALLARWTLSQDEVILGNGPDATVPIRDPSLAAVHARITRRGGSWTLQPLAPTKINGIPAEGRVALANGDRLALGDVTLLFIVLAAPVALPPPTVTSTGTAPSMVPVARESGMESTWKFSDESLRRMLDLPSDGYLSLPPTEARVPAPSRASAAPAGAPPPPVSKSGEPPTLSELIMLAEQGTISSLGLRFPLLISGASPSLRDPSRSLVYQLPVFRASATGRDEEWLNVGRDPVNEIVILGDSGVSRKHAALVRQQTAGRWFVFDHGSTNGTFLDGIRIKVGQLVELVKPLVTLRFGTSAPFIFLQEVALAEYLASFQGQPMPAARAAPAGDLARQTGAHSADPLYESSEAERSPAEEILQGIESASIGARRWIVRMDGARVEEAKSWEELAALVAVCARKIESIETASASGRPTVLYQRP